MELAAAGGSDSTTRILTEHASLNRKLLLSYGLRVDIQVAKFKFEPLSESDSELEPDYDSLGFN